MSDILTKAIQKRVHRSMYQYAVWVCELLRSGKSEKQTKAILTAKVKHAATPKGIDIVFKVGCAMWAAEKNGSLPVIVETNGNN